MEQNQIEEVSHEELSFIEGKKREYIEQGASEVEAIALATDDWKKAKEKADQEGEALWDKITKDIGAHDFIEDMVRRALVKYKEVWNKKNHPQTLDFELKMYSDPGPSGVISKNRLIAGAGLRLSVIKNGVHTLWRDKKVAFTHIRDMREGHKWKMALWEAMFQDILGWGVSYALAINMYQDNKHLTQTPKDGEPANTQPEP